MNLNYEFKNSELLKQALTHPSLCKKDRIQSYERLEFLGDSVLGIIIAENLYKKFPQEAEGKLSVMHSNLVNKNTLAEVAKSISLGDDLLMDVGEERNGGRSNTSNLENAMEALIGAVYMDSDFNTVKHIVNDLWKSLLENIDANIEKDSKSKLQEWAQKNGKSIPEYEVVSREGEAHNPTFIVKVKVEGLKPVEAKGKSKKVAEQAAATKILEEINE